jgi:hypothetical protein
LAWRIEIKKQTKPYRAAWAVYACSEGEAIARVVKEFKIGEALRNRIVARKEDY